MNEQEFKRLMARVKHLGGDYAAGYQRGLRRLYHGESFGTEAEHAQWMRLGLDGDYREELGRGYRDGFNGVYPTPKEGRPELPPCAVRRTRSLRFTDSEWEKLQSLGGADWVVRMMSQ